MIQFYICKQKKITLNSKANLDIKKKEGKFKEIEIIIFRICFIYNFELKFNLKIIKKKHSFLFFSFIYETDRPQQNQMPPPS